jgi:hypothetical protein
MKNIIKTIWTNLKERTIKLKNKLKRMYQKIVKYKHKHKHKHKKFNQIPILNLNLNLRVKIKHQRLLDYDIALKI